MADGIKINTPLVMNSITNTSYPKIVEKVHEPAKKTRAGLKDYIAIARPDEWIKNIFVLPGILFALAVHPIPLSTSFFWNFIIGIISTCLVASANYVINEYLDAEFVKYHPLKKKRPSVVQIVDKRIVYTEYILLAMLGLSLAYSISARFFVITGFFLFMGGVYNVRPFRSKDRVFLDVLSESINNPIRFIAGWFIVNSSINLNTGSIPHLRFWEALPPLSIIVAYWMGGAFLMATKRFAEYRLIDDPRIAGLYRKSFKYYTENSLLISMFFYGITCSFFLGIFLVKNRIEMLLSFPFFALLFAWYLKIGLLKNSPVQGRERLYTRKWFMLYLILFTILLCTLMLVDIPLLKWFLIHTND
jgi:decaprenyl-phosphate phosphoribosyltransferase